ncbi:MAG: 3-hydroxyacyl-ACP dehydratase FabZ [Spirochaetales bacterium]|jgi:3-hydroxyacyl-[acyl-carrier-protein] dehydratase|nr:3-hydroxyacyl-ACP dehydratase FabZ [Spirochaetales bacterium]
MNKDENKKGQDLSALLPHRYPFLFVDAILEADERRIIGERTWTPEDFFFQGHFPEYPVVPGVILIETLAQCGGAGLRSLGILNSGDLFFLASIEKAKFRSQVRPGDKVRLEIENLRISPKMIRQRGLALVGDVPAAEAQWLCLVGKGL